MAAHHASLGDLGYLPACTKKVLSAMLDTLLPPPLQLAPPYEKITKLSDLPLVVEKVIMIVNSKLTAKERLELSFVLAALNTAAGCSLLGLSLSFKSFPDMSLSERSQVLSSLRDSSLSLRRKLFTGLKRLLLGVALSYSVQPDSANSLTSSRAQHINPLWGDSSPSLYPGPPFITNGPAKPLQPPHDYDFLPYGGMSTSYDYVVVGSGAGGGVAAATLSQAGYKVLVLEKGPVVAAKDFSQVESEGMGDLYEKGSLLTTSDGNIIVLAGSGLGGGTRINWACCLDTPEYVRKEWAEERGLTQFSPNSEFDEALKIVKARISVSGENVTQNEMNKRMIEGCDNLGLKWKVAPQNFKDTSRKSCGWTCFGDREGNKQSGVETFLLDAAKAGAHFMRADVLKVTRAGGRATGVLVQPTGTGGTAEKPISIAAKKGVIVSAGSLHTPCLLLRSGLTNYNVGRHLKMHPCTAVIANTDKEIHGYEGAPMTTVCGAVEMGPNNDGHGPKLECPSVHLGVMAAALPWLGGEEFKDCIFKAARKTAIVVLQRDKGEGRVSLCEDGFGPKIDYTLCKADEQSIMLGIRTAFHILNNVSDVVDICSLNSRAGSAFVKTPHTTASDVDSYVDKVSSYGCGANEMGMFCAHQMGSSRMSISPDTGVCDCDGETWECDGLYVCDASVFPSASGSNPMITTLAIASMICNRLVKMEAGGEDGDRLATIRRDRRWKAKRGKTRRMLKSIFGEHYVVMSAIATAALGFGIRHFGLKYINKHR